MGAPAAVAMIAGAGSLGAGIGTGLYAANTIRTGQEMSYKDAAIAGGAGFVAGALIAGGPIIATTYGSQAISIAASVTNAGMGIASSGLSYLGSNTITGSQFSSKDFLITTSVNGIAGSMGPTAYWNSQAGVSALGATANTIDVALRKGGNVSTGDLLYAITSGAVAGYAGGTYNLRPGVGNLMFDPVKFPGSFTDKFIPQFSAGAFRSALVSNGLSPFYGPIVDTIDSCIVNNK